LQAETFRTGGINEGHPAWTFRRFHHLQLRQPASKNTHHGTFCMTNTHRKISVGHWSLALATVILLMSTALAWA
jgi:hypothetical protein